MTTKLVSAVGSADGGTERPLDVWRVPVSEQGERFVQEIIRRVECYESETGRRKRKRKPKDELTFCQAITSVASDLAVYALAGESYGVYPYHHHHAARGLPRDSQLTHDAC